MNIGILTFHFGNNFGALMQCYALQEYLISCNHNVKVLNYIPPNIKPIPYWRQLISRKISLSKILKIIKKEQYASIQNEQFVFFRNKYFNLTKLLTYDNLSDINNEFDAIIVGSDQIWNPSQHKTGSYFLSHLDKFNGKRISYAPCCALNTIEEKNKNKILTALNKFQSISVRNKETRSFVFDLINKTPPIVVDPTLLWEFDELISKEPFIKENYICTYILGKEINGGHKKIINAIKKKYPYHQIISVILTDNNPQLFNWSDKTYWTASPIEWLNLLYYSSFIYTDSFHGVLFSIKFKKPFIAYYAEKARSTRFVDLAQRFGNISNSIVESTDDAIKKDSFNQIIDFNALEIKLDHEIKKSKKFLYDALTI